MASSLFSRSAGDFTSIKIPEGVTRIGNAAFAKSYNKRVCRTVRVQNGNDLITKLPPAFLGYRHVGAAFNVGSIRLPFVVSKSSHLPHKYYKELICSGM